MLGPPHEHVISAHLLRTWVKAEIEACFILFLSVAVNSKRINILNIGQKANSGDQEEQSDLGLYCLPKRFQMNFSRQKQTTFVVIGTLRVINMILSVYILSLLL